ncbi:MAG: glycoside hydrolase family 95 protein, partial [Clostridia bacterium]|nr:glycoside hydrolase family 95 protein [Clostridia bacterium]
IAYKRENLTSLEYPQDGFFARGLTAKGEHAFAVGARIETDGAVSACGEGIAVKNAKTLALYLSAATEFSLGEDFCALLEKRLALRTPFGDLLGEHVRDFTAFSRRSDLVLGGDPALSRLPVGARLERLRNDPGARDPALAALYFAFGKYLLISSSRADTLPANLQGVWVESLENAWNADYHTNINLQMNYWQAETANLGECCEALFRYMNGTLLPAGARVARDSYGCRGSVVHHLSDIYGYAAPADGLWGLWPHGAGWLSTHLWEHYLFTRDESFLRGTAYDFMKACALFYMDYMFEDRGGRLISGPSTSPENRYYLPVGDEKREMFLCFSPTMDIEIISAVLRNYIDAEEILGSDPGTREAARRALSRMPALTVGPDGRLNEWLEPYDEPEPGHRHISHAFALYPDHAIGPDTPELLDAIRRTLEKRLSCGGGHTGWSRAWLINLFARLGDGGAAGEHLRLLLTRSTLPNLLDTHPPFQIDGNFGGAAGVGEMLLQSRNDEISICPAVPDWFSGSFRGFKARGNVVVGAEIDRGRPTGFSLRAAFDGAYTVRLPRDGTVEFGGTKISTDRGAFRVTLSAGRETVFHVE